MRPYEELLFESRVAMSSVRSRLWWSKVNLDSPFNRAILILVVAILSYLSTVLGSGMAVPPHNISPLWPTNAVILIVLLAVPRRLWPILLATAYAVVGFLDVRFGVPIAFSLWLVLGNAVEVIVAAFAVSYFFSGVPRLNSTKRLAEYLLFASILAPLAGAFIGALAAKQGSYWLHWRMWVLSDGLALFTLPPVVWGLVHSVLSWRHKSLSYYLELTTVTVLLVLFGYATLVASGRNTPQALLYPLVLFLLWSAFRFGSMGTSISVIVVSILAIWGAVHGRGPFLELGPVNNVLSLQLFLLCTAAPFMVLAALVEEHQDSEQALREREERLRVAAEVGRMYAWEWNPATDSVLRSAECASILGLSDVAREGVGKDYFSFIHPADRDSLWNLVQSLTPEAPVYRLHYRRFHPDGALLWLEESGYATFGRDGKMLRLVGMTADVTDRKRSEEALRESEDKLRLLLDSTAEAICGTDLEGRCTFCNAACVRMLGYESVEELLGKNMHDLIHHTRANGTLFPAEECRIFQAIRIGEEVHAENEVLWRANGTAFPVELWSYPQRRGQEVIGTVVAFIDITERKRSEEALASVSRRLIHAQEQERIRIARELHDDIGQRLSMLNIGLQQLQQTGPSLNPEVLFLVNELEKQTSELATDTQSLSHELHSSKLELLGIGAAMRAFCKEFGDHQKVDIDFESHDLPRFLQPEIALCLFRVLQEAVRNSAKHSGVRDFQVRSWGTSNGIYLTVRDSGVGFEIDLAKNSRGLGLISMEERLKLVNGTLSIESQPNSGTTIRARVPLSSGRDSELLVSRN
jgi:PAS domain S-box-containing protein